MVARIKVTERPHISRMEPRYSPKALEKQIEGHYENAAMFEEQAKKQRQEARKLEGLLRTVREDFNQQMKSKRSEG